MNSYDKINYKLRPQKRIERALFVELINKFRYGVHGPINYVGMGSLYYTDFVYFHKNCDIDKMLSIEYMKDKEGNINYNKEKRFLSNKPLDKIELISKKVSEAVFENDLPFEENNFIWYDYDGSFLPYIISDLAETLMKVKKSTILSVSYNGYFPYDFIGENKVIDLKTCFNQFKNYIVGEAIEENDFTKSKYVDTVGKICERYLQNTIDDRNDEESKAYKLVRLSKIVYQDGAKMITDIWAFIDPEQDHDLEAEFSGLKILGMKDLTMENLTLYEKIYLDRHYGETYIDLANNMGLELTTIERYFEYAKYIPEFTEIMI